MNDSRDRDYFGLALGGAIAAIAGMIWTVASWAVNGYPDLVSILVLLAGLGTLAWWRLRTRLDQIDDRPSPTPMDDA